MINVIGDIMAQYKIAVDAGHGGGDNGVKNIWGNSLLP